MLFASLRLSQINEINYNNTANIDRIINNLALERGASELAIITSNGNILFASKNSFFYQEIFLLQKYFQQEIILTLL